MDTVQLKEKLQPVVSPRFVGMMLLALFAVPLATAGGACIQCLRKAAFLYAVFTPLTLFCLVDIGDRRTQMDLLFLLLTIALFGATIGLGALCARLMERKS